MNKLLATAVGCISICGFWLHEAHAQAPVLDVTADFASTKLPQHFMWNWVRTGFAPIDLRKNRKFDSRAVVGMECFGTTCYDIDLVAAGTKFKSYGTDFDTRVGLPQGTGARSAECPGTDMLMTGISCAGTDCGDPTIYCAKFYGLRTENCYWRSAFPSTNTRKLDLLPPQQFVAGLRCNGPLCSDTQLKACHVGPGSGEVGGVQQSGTVGVRIRSIGSGLYLGHDVGYGPGFPFKQYADPSGDNKKFVLRQMNTSDADYSYFAINAVDSSLCMNIEGGMTWTGIRLLQWPCSSSAENNKFLLRELKDGQFQILAKHSNLCLEVPNSSTAIDAVVTQQPCNGTRSGQLFEFIKS
ncbi:MAG: RICIN domain-containing protein [Rhodanobacteraceae bacterium]|nr:RICIN domain-containing protein [Rhodanobacteraceae bacterium]